jgi:hypothetical protein
MTNTENTSSYTRDASIEAPAKIVPAECYRCGGAGGSTGWPGFTCYRCGGCGVDPSHTDYAYPAAWSDADIEAFHAARDAKAQARRDREGEKLAAKYAANRAANEAAYPALAEIIPAVIAEIERCNEINDTCPATYEKSTFGSFVTDVALKAQFHTLSDRQAETLIEAFGKDLEKAAKRTERKAADQAQLDAAPALVAERREIEGTVISLKTQESQYGFSYKMLVKLDDGNKVFGTQPSSLSVKVGDRVRLTATIEPSRDDIHFGFYSRPSKSENLGGE